MAFQDNVPAEGTVRSPASSARKTRIGVIIAVVFATAVGFLSGSAYTNRKNIQDTDSIVRNVTGRDDGVSRAVDFTLFWQVWDQLHESYVDSDKLDAVKLVYGAIHGMVEAAGDPYTVFLEPVDAKAFQEEVSGAFSGVGMEVGERDGLITVIAPLKDSPAFRAGVLAGDIVVKIDDQDTDGLSVEQAVSRIRGKEGTTVHLTLMREGADEFLELNIVRDVIRIPAVDWRMLDGNIAYLQVFTFNGNVEDEFAAAARAAQQGGATRIILDLRNNPGGLLDASVNLAAWFLPSDSLVVEERFGDGTTEDRRTTNNARLVSLPVVVLVNGGSASASEILAGAIHDIRSVPLVGEKTYGKGSVQQLEGFYNGSYLKVTIAKWFTPNGVSISDTGITPTDEVLMEAKDFAEKGWELGTVGKDPQLDRALEIVRQLQ